MDVHAYKTCTIKPGADLRAVLSKYLPVLTENCVVAVTSKIVSLAENRVVSIDSGINKLDLIHSEAEKYLEDPEYFSRYHISITVKDSNLVASSGVDESNGNGNYILWPQNPDQSAENIWQHLRQQYSLKHVGVIITDSHTTPLRWGVTGTCLGWCGFKPLYDYTGKPDIFGRPFKFEKTSLIDSLATVATLVMGEGNEKTPLAVINDVPYVQFQPRPPTPAEINSLKISLDDDIYAPLLTRVKWQTGHKRNS
jgi:dihydrofolate synthase / folylpolyglutamate synthase